MRAYYVFVAGFSLLLIASCAQTMATAPAKPLPAPVVATACPPLKAYSREQEAAMAAALKALPVDSPLVGAMADYGALRAAVRACVRG